MPKRGLRFNRVALAAVLGTDVGVGQGQGSPVRRLWGRSRRVSCCGSSDMVRRGWLLGRFGGKAFLMNWMWGRWWEKWEVKEEERLLAQASVRMEFLLFGMEKAAGEAVLGRRWEFGLGLARGVSFRLMQAAHAPEVVEGRAFPGHGRLLQGPLKHCRWCPPFPEDSLWHSWPCFEKNSREFCVLQLGRCLLPKWHWKLLGSVWIRSHSRSNLSAPG